MKIQLQNGWTKESLKARITERVPADGRCAEGDDCIYFDPATGKSCAIGSLILPEEASALGMVSVECLLGNEVLGYTLRKTGPFPRSLDYQRFQVAHDDAPLEGPPGYMHDVLHKWIDERCEDPK